MQFFACCKHLYEREGVSKTLLVMKITTFFLIVFCLNASAGGYAQKVNLDQRNVPLNKVFKEIKKQTGFTFVYTGGLLRQATRVTITMSDASLEQVLEACFRNQPLSYSIFNKMVVVKEKDPIIVTEIPLAPPISILVKGEVVNEKGEALSGATVTEKGTNNVVATKEDGSFSINTLSSKAILIVSYVGYATREIAVNNQANISITLVQANANLGDVVVVGYGSVRKSDVTGSVSRVGAAAIEATPIVALDRAMQGRVSGVQVTTNSARPGGSTTIRIRGAGSVNAGNEPLYVIDGFPTNNLNSINPSDIETLDILKDASATAIYGSRGSNGVVLITTKRGKAGQSIIEFDSYYGIQSARRKIPVLNGKEYAEFLNEARVNGGGVAYFNGSGPERPLPSAIGEGTNWQDVVFRDAPMKNYQLSISGGEAKTRYSLSTSLYDQSGIVINSRFRRATLRANIDHDVSSKLKIGLSLQGAYINSDAASTEAGNHRSNVTSAALNYASVFPKYNADGSYFRDPANLNPFPTDNPLALATEILNKTKGIRVFTNVYAEAKILKNLTFRTTWGADLNSNKFNNYNSRKLLLSSGIGNASVGSDQDITWQSENTLSYSSVFKQKHVFNALLGYTFQETRYEFAQATASGFNSDFATYNNLGAATIREAPSSAVSQSALLSYLGRVNYGYDSRYLFTLTARRDGSSRLGPTKKFGYFPSGAFAWRVSNEKFMTRQKLFSDLKVRVSYGLTGNQSIGDYRFLSSLNNSSYPFNGALFVGSSPNGVSNLNLQWEKNQQFDVGLDLSVLNNRIQFTVDYYKKKTYDLLFDLDLPLSSGYFTSLTNVGSIENKGWEFAVNTHNIDTKNFQWKTAFNISFNKNKVLKLDGRPQFQSGTGNGDLQINNPILLKVGQPLGNFYGRIMDGIFQNQAEVDKSAQKNAKPGDIRYKDINGDGTISDLDRTVIGNGYPKFFGGLDNTVTFKNFDLNIFLQGSYGNEILNLSRLELYGLNGQNQAKEIVNRWTPTNPSNTIPRANTAGGQKILSSYLIEDGSYLRLKNISLGYQLPALVLKKLLLQSAKVYVSAQNWLTLTNYKGYDPEVSYQGNTAISQSIDLGAYPNSKTILVGVNLKF